MLMDVPSRDFVLAGSLEELKAKGRLVLHGSHRPILVIYDRGRVFAFSASSVIPQYLPSDFILSSVV
jgi:predicted ATPase